MRNNETRSRPTPGCSATNHNKPPPAASMTLPHIAIGRNSTRAMRRPASVEAIGQPIRIGVSTVPASSAVPPSTPWTNTGT